jgi:hypothetical protein
MGLWQKFFSPLAYIGSIVLVLLGLSPAEVAAWLAERAPLEVSSWIWSNRGRWAFVLGGVSLFGVNYWRNHRRALSVSSQVPTPVPDVGIPDALLINVGGAEPYKVTNYSDDGIRHEIVRVEVINTGIRPLYNCRLEIEQMEPDTNGNSFVLRDEFSLPPGDRNHTDVARLDSTADHRSPIFLIRIPTLAEKREIRVPLVDADYTLKLRATATRSHPCEAECRLRIDSAGMLRLERI